MIGSRARRIACYIALLVDCTLCGCTAHTRSSTAFCGPPQRDVHSQLNVGPDLPAGTTREAQLAALLGVGDALAERAHGPLPTATRIRVLERLARARITIDAVEAELDCEAERTKQAADYLTSKQDTIVQNVTVASIVAAAAVSVASVLLSTKDASAEVEIAVGIGGAAVAAGLGFATLYVEPTLQLDDDRNLLRDIWNGPIASSAYPPIVWAYLSRATFSNNEDLPIRERIVQRFHHLGAVDDDDANTRRLLFGEGGEFDAETLRARAALLEQVKAEVALENQDLQLLADRLLHDGPQAPR